MKHTKKCLDGGVCNCSVELSKEQQETSNIAISGKNSRIFLASPYTHKDKEIMALRYEAALKAAAKLIKEGNMVFSPVVHSHPIAITYDLPKDYTFWQAYTKSFIVNWAEVFSTLCLEGWQDSEGINKEFDLAKKAGLSFSYIHLG